MKPQRTLIGLILLVLISIVPVLSAAQEARVVFMSPQRDTLWLGKQEIKVQLRYIDPESVHSVAFYLNGRLIREMRSTPYAFTFDFGQKPKFNELKVVVRSRNDIIVQHNIWSYQYDDAQEVDVLHVMVPVTVTDDSGNYVRALEKDDFILMEEGVEQDIANFSTGGQMEFHLILLIDISTSMQEKIGVVKESAKIFLDQLITKKDRAMVVFFNHDVFADMDFTTDMSELNTSISATFPFGSTAMYDAIAHCINLVKGNPGRNIIILFSDGKDNSSFIDPFTLTKRVERSNAVIHSIGASDTSAADMTYQDLLRNISETSGGMTFFIDNVREVENVYRDLNKDIRTRYVLEFTPKNLNRLNRFRKITVKLKKHRRYKVRTIKGYYH